MNEAVKEAIRTGKTALGIEFGSTRIKAVLVDESHAHIVWRTTSGPTAWKISGKACRDATRA